ncbi:FecCD family ABC transporter permease [Streptomyces sp. NPDC054796]
MDPPPQAASSPLVQDAAGDAVRAALRAVRRSRRAHTRRTLAVSLGLLAALAAALCCSLAYGDLTLPLSDVLAALAGGGTGGADFIVLELRLPRALTGILVGVAFGLSGAVFQTLLRNPLASPDVIGVSAGASAAAVAAIALFGLGGAAVSASALAGAVLAAALIHLLAWRRGVTGYRLVLVGVGVSAVLMSVVSYAMTLSETVVAEQAKVWLTGSLNGRDWSHAVPLLVALAVLLPLTAAGSRALKVLQLGDDTARGLGARTERARVLLLLCAVALVGVATAAAGPVGFVAFVAGPLARGLLRRDDPALVPSALTGALIVLASDFVAQHLLGARQFPVGVVTSVVGAPYLLWLLARSNRGGRGG